MTGHDDPSVTGTGRRKNLVFVSYSRTDVQIMEQIAVMFRPLVEDKRYTLWTDVRSLRLDEEWEVQILDAIDRSRLALLLVSPDFLTSKFIMNTELPGLRDRGVVLAPILVRPCLWKFDETLRKLQWAHDPAPGRSLAELTGTDREAEIVRIADRIADHLPRLEPRPRSGRAHVADVEALSSADLMGPLDGVPALPPSYMPRDAVAEVVGSLLADGSSGAVGITGATRGVGLHGDGGVGKSVLASAVARTEEVRRRFPDGVHWVTVGQDGDVVALQKDLLHRLGRERPNVDGPDDGREQLQELLRDRRVLLVVDDVWRRDAARAFRVVGRHGRVLYTCRAGQVLRTAGAELRSVGALTAEESRALAAAILKDTADGLPPEATAAFEAVHNVALAVSLVAATVRGGRSWADAVAALRANDAIYRQHPYADNFKAIQLAVASLDDALRAAYLSMVVFPQDAKIPTGAVVRLWRRPVARTRRMLAALAEAKLLGYDAGKDTTTFHDLQLEYLLLQADELAELHDGFLQNYRDDFDDPGDGWWQLTEHEPYIWRHLMHHLDGAQVREDISTTYADPAFLAKRLSVAGRYETAQDIARARARVPDDARLAAVQRWLAAHAHLLGGLSRSTDIAATMQAWLRSAPELPVDAGRLDPLLPAWNLDLRWGLRGRDPTGGSGAVQALACSAHGRRLACAGEGKAIQLRTFDGEPIRELHGHTRSVRAVAFSPDGRFLASGDAVGQVLLWDVVGMQSPTPVGRHEGRVRAVAFSPDGAQLASAGDDLLVRLWDGRTGADHGVLQRHGGGVRAVAFSPDGSRLVSAGEEDAIRISDTQSLDQLATLNGNRGWVTAISVAPDGTIAAAGHERTIRFWDRSCDGVGTIEGHEGHVVAVAFSPDGELLLSADERGELKIWRWREPECLCTVRLDRCTDAAWTTAGIAVATQGEAVVFRVRRPDGRG